RRRRPAEPALLLPVGPEPRVDPEHRRARPEHPGGLHGAGVDRPWRVHVGRRLHGGEPRQPSGFALARQSTRGRPHGGADRRHRWDPVTATPVPPPGPPPPPPPPPPPLD